MIEVQCDCGKFRAELKGMPKNTPGRAVCYCDDCQTFLHHLGRPELLDQNGGTEIIPVYPSEFKIVSGAEQLRCTRLSPKGLYRWWVACCKTPVGNTTPGFPWVGTLNRIYAANGPEFVEQKLGPIKCRIQGRFAHGTPPEGTSAKASFKDLKVIFPFLLKGFLTGKAKPSPFFQADNKTPIIAPDVMSLHERNTIRERLK